MSPFQTIIGCTLKESRSDRDYISGHTSSGTWIDTRCRYFASPQAAPKVRETTFWSRATQQMGSYWVVDNAFVMAGEFTM